MTAPDDRDLDAVDAGLSALFADDSAVPPRFTADVLRRVQEERWRRQRFLGRVLYAGVSASGILVLLGLWFGLGALTTTVEQTPLGLAAPASLIRLSGEAAMKMALAGLALTAFASWRRLGSLLR